MASALYIDAEYGSKLYMRIHVYSLLSFLWSFRYFFCNYSVFQCRYHIFGVLVEAARLVCTTENALIADPRQWACGMNTPGSFEMLSAVLV